MRHKPSDLEFISMTVSKPLKLFSICMLFAAMSGCGDLFGAGGVSLEGTGNGKPTVPGMGNAGEDKTADSDYKLNLSLGASAVDSCNLVIRELQFINTASDTAVFQNSVIPVNFDKDGIVPVTVQLTLENANASAVEIEYAHCDVPLMLQNAAADVQYFPARECSAMKTELLASDEIRSFRLNYSLDTAMQGNWSVHRKLKMSVPGQPAEQCEPLLLPISLTLK